MVRRMVMTAILATAGALALAQTTPIQPEAGVVTYDDLMIKPLGERIRLFNQISPENRADLVRTQITRWLERNADRLSDEQQDVIEECLAFATADHYRIPRTPEDEALARALAEKAARLFSQEDARQAFTIRGDYIPPAPK